MSIALGYIQPGMVHSAFMDCVLGYLAHDANHRNTFGGYVTAQSPYIPDGRNKVCEAFLESTKAEWLWMVDYDVIFKPEDVYTLLDVADPVERPIMAGCYFNRFGEGNYIWPVWMEERDGHPLSPVSALVPGHIRELTVCGMGFTLIHRSVLEKMQDEIDDPWKWFGHDIVEGSRTGEDITFCTRARSLGFSIWGHSSVQLGHVKSHRVEYDDFASQDFAGLMRGPSVTVRT